GQRQRGFLTPHLQEPVAKRLRHSFRSKRSSHSLFQPASCPCLRLKSSAETSTRGNRVHDRFFCTSSHARCAACARVDNQPRTQFPWRASPVPPPCPRPARATCAGP